MVIRKDTQEDKMKNIMFIAPPAAGKGTQAEMLKEKYTEINWIQIFLF